MRLVQLLTIVSITAVAGACAPSGDEGRFDSGPGPGAEAWNSDNVSCETDADCGPGESCGEGVCQMKRCDEPYDSSAPLGARTYFGIDAEVAVLSDQFWIDGFDGDGSYLNSWNLEGNQLVDVAGGNFDGNRPHGIAAAVEFSDRVILNLKGGTKEISTGIWPTAIAAGDVDGDGLDELVAFSSDGSIAVCHIDTNQCSGATISGIEGTDVAVADVDGDGFDEPIFLLRAGGKTEIIVWNMDAATTGQEPTLGWELNISLKSIAAGDLDGDGVAEVVGLEDGGWWGWTDDKLHVFSPASGEITYSRGVDGHSDDVGMGDRDADDKEEVALLRSDNKLELFAGAQLTGLFSTTLAVGQNGSRVAMLDWDGDSASGNLLDGPELVAGEIVPVSLLLFPPYPSHVSNGASGVLVGDTQSTSESLSDTVALNVGLSASIGADLGPFKATVGAFLEKHLTKTQTTTKNMVIGQRLTLDADPAMYGDDYAAIVLSCGCYHRYGYLTDDPAGKIGGSGKRMDVFVPVGGQSQMWSIKRYNAMAAATGKLPIINIPYRVGTVDTYPQGQPTTIGGAPILPGDMVFPNTPLYQASDVGKVGFWLTVAESETNETAQTTLLGTKASFGLFGAGLDFTQSIGVTQGYSITVGKEAIFAGSIPAIPDDPDTPEDEFALHRYSFAPIVYREHYINSSGEDAAYYVLSYTASMQQPQP